MNWRMPVVGILMLMAELALIIVTEVLHLAKSILSTVSVFEDKT